MKKNNKKISHLDMVPVVQHIAIDDQIDNGVGHGRHQLPQALGPQPPGTPVRLGVVGGQQGA